jgi:hypothetical protein
MLRKAILEDNR